MNAIWKAIVLALTMMIRPPIETMPLSVTSYWFYDDSGNAVALNGQADEWPNRYANGVRTHIYHEDLVAACIQDWVFRVNTTEVSFIFWGNDTTVVCYDTFGLPSYREPFFHDGYGEWVIPIDILSSTPYHGLVYDWSTRSVPVREEIGK